MTDVFTIRPQRRAPSAALVPYVLITFAIAWGIIGLYIFRPVQAVHRHTPALCHGGPPPLRHSPWCVSVTWFGEITGTHPLYVMATWAPAPLLPLRHSPWCVSLAAAPDSRHISRASLFGDVQSGGACFC